MSDKTLITHLFEFITLLFEHFQVAAEFTLKASLIEVEVLY